MSKFKTGDLVRYLSSSTGYPVFDTGPAANEWRASRIGLVLSEDPPLPRRAISAGGRLYNVLWNDDTKSLIVPEWDLELVSEEG